MVRTCRAASADHDPRGDVDDFRGRGTANRPPEGDGPRMVRPAPHGSRGSNICLGGVAPIRSAPGGVAVSRKPLSPTPDVPWSPRAVIPRDRRGNHPRGLHVQPPAVCHPEPANRGHNRPAGGRDPPRVWLCPRALCPGAGIRFTFFHVPERHSRGPSPRRACVLR